MEIYKGIKCTQRIALRCMALLACMTATLHAAADTSVGTPAGSFSVSETGAAVYAIPFDISPSGTGFDPKIGLAYNSQQTCYGNAGYGVSITGISCITRTGKDLYHDSDFQKVRYMQGDNYLLDGKRLYLKDGTQGTDGSTYTVEGNPYATVTLHGSDDTGNYSMWFELKDADGNIYKYQKWLYIPASGIYRTVAWYVTMATNKYGDTINYSYVNNGNVIYPASITYGRAGCTNSIEFSYESLAQPQKFIVEGGIEGQIAQRLSSVTTKYRNNTNRVYTLSYSTSDASNRKFDRLVSVNVQNGNGDILKPIALNWNYLKTATIDKESKAFNELGEGFSEVDKFFSSADINGDGISDIIRTSIIQTNGISDLTLYITLANSSFSTTSGTVTFQEQRLRDNSLYAFNSKYKGRYLGCDFTCNIDGDSRADIIIPLFNSYCPSMDASLIKQVVFNITTGNEICTSNNINAYPFIYTLHDSASGIPLYYTLDLDSDGKEDLIYVEQNPYDGRYYGNIVSGEVMQTVIESKSGVAPPIPLQFKYSDNQEIKRMFLVDCNADGLQDVVLLFEDGYKIYFNNGGTELASVFTEANSQEVTNSSTLKDYWRMEQGDFDGDGLVDFVCIPKSEWYMKFMRNNGDGSFTLTGSANVDFIDKNDGDDDVRFAVRVADFDKDGRSDVFVSKEDLEYHGWLKGYSYRKTQIRCYLSDGTKPVLWKSIDKTRDADDSKEAYIFTGDFNGDGYVELANYGSRLDSSTDNTFIENQINIYPFSTDISLGHVASITDGFGKKTTITYASGTNPSVYTAGDANACDSLVNTYTLPLPLVSHVNQTNGAAASQNIDYHYGDLRTHVQGRGLLGFSTMTVNNTTLGTKTETKVTGWDANKFIPSSVFVTTTTGGDTSRTTSKNEIESTRWNGNYFSYCKSSTAEDFDQHITKTEYYYDLEKGVLTQESTFYDVSDDSDGRSDMYKKTDYKNYVLKEGKYVPQTVTQTQKHSDDDNEYIVTDTYTYNDKGDVVQDIHVSKYPGEEDVTLTTDYTRDAYGNVLSELTTGGVANVTKYNEYDAQHLRLTKTHTDPSSVVNTYTYDMFGNVIEKRDESNPSNMLTTTYTYDGWGSLIKTVNPDGTSTSTATSWDSGKSKGVYKTIVTSTAQAPLTTYYDSEGREVFSSTIGIGNIVTSKTTGYNSLGKVTRETCVTGKLTSSTYQSYDSFGRITSSTSAEGATTRYSYNDNDRTVTVKAPTGTTTKKYDSWGNIQSTTDNAATVTYTYNSIGKPSQVNADNAIVKMRYDAAGYKTQLDDPDAGTQTYVFSADGAVLSQRDGNGMETTYKYDRLGRQVLRECGDIKEVTEYGASGYELNRVKSKSCNGYTETYEYDEYGRVKSDKRETTNGTYTITYKYNANGQLDEVSYPGNVVVAYSYDSYGNMISATANGKNFFTQGDYNGLKAVTKSGSLISTHRLYPSTGLTAYKTISIASGEELDRINYTYDPTTINVDCRWRGAITGDVADEWNNYIEHGGSEYETDWDYWSCDWDVNDDVVMPQPNEDYYPVDWFGFDNMDRLTSVREAGPDMESIDKTIKYDDNGNITYKTAIGKYNYSTNKPHAVSGIYDLEDGISQTGLSTAFNDDGKIESISCTLGGAVKRTYFYYGPDREKWEMTSFLKAKTSGGSNLTPSTHHFYFGDYERITKNSSVTEQYFLDNGVILIQKDGELNFYKAFSDIQGSILSVYDIDSGEQVFRASYDAWGRQVIEQNDIDLSRGYCGHDMLSDYDLIDMGGRVYDPVIGRFLSCDNYVQEPDNSQNFNRYSYCLNNPLRYTDPDGEFWWIVAGAVGAYIGGAMANNWQMNPAKWNYSYAGTYLGMGIGAITGGIGGGAVLAGTASVSVNALTPFVSVGATYGGPGTYTNGWSYGWETAAGGGAIISKHGYSDEAVKYGIDAQVADIAQTYAAYESGYDYNWDFSAFAAVTPFTAVLAADDASVIGVADDPVAGLLLTGALCKTAYDNRAYIAHGIERATASIERMKTLTLNCRPGYVYHLVATQSRDYPNVRGGYTHLNAGDTWKIGETINGEARYGQKYLDYNKLMMVQRSPYMTNKYLLWMEEKRQLIEYVQKYGSLPPGNKMFK